MKKVFIITMCLISLALSTTANARAMYCQQCNKGTVSCVQTTYYWAETGNVARCDDCGSIRRQLRKYSLKKYKCNNCGDIDFMSTPLNNYMWACECDE